MNDVKGDVKRKVLLDLFVNPSTIIPVVGGLTLLIGSWATGGHPVADFAGVAGVLGGMGLMVTRWIYGLESITERAHEFVQERFRHQREESLQRLDEQLSQDSDPRPERCLRDLRRLHQTFQERVTQKHSPTGWEILEKVDRLFAVCVEHLQQTHRLWETSQTVRGTARDNLLQERELLIEEAIATVRHLSDAVQRYEALAFQKKRSDLSSLRNELDESLRAARAAEERLSHLDQEIQPGTRE